MSRHIQDIDPAARRLIAELSAQAAKLASGEKDPTTLQARLDILRDKIELLKASVAKAGEARYTQLSEQQKALHHAAFVTNEGDPAYHALDSLSFESEGKSQSMKVPKGDILYQFRKDVNEGKLPTISWLTAPESSPTIQPHPGTEPGTSPR